MILRMDWLSRHQVVVDCIMKRVALRTSSGEEVTFISKRLKHLSNVISAATAKTMVRMGCEAYLAYVIDTKRRSLVYHTSLQFVIIWMCFLRIFGVASTERD